MHVPFNVLLLGERESGWDCLGKQLQKRGCRCRFTQSPKDALALDGPHAYELILTSVPVSQIELFVGDLCEVNANVFYCHPVEDGCWWLPVVRHGRKCFGAPGTRGSEFLAILDQILRDSRSQALAPSAAETKAASASRA
ncbi:MAG: hypothetical protein ACRD4R_04845 [Candidatus Acidiferrales bacterium]